MKKTNFSIMLYTCILTMLISSLNATAALPMTGYVEKSLPEYFDYDYTTHALANKSGTAFLYPYALLVGDSFKVSYAGGDNPFVALNGGTITTELYDIKGVPHGVAISGTENTLSLEDDTSAKMVTITAKGVGTYCVKFTETTTNGGNKVSYVYVVVVPDDGGNYTLELPERATLTIQEPSRGKTYVGIQLLLQPLAVDQEVTVKMYATAETYGSDKGLRLTTHEAGASNPEIASLKYKDGITDSSVNLNGMLIPFDADSTTGSGTTEGFCTIATIKAESKGYAYVRFRIPGYGTVNSGTVQDKHGNDDVRSLAIEVPVEYNRPAVKNAITSSAYGYKGAHEQRNVILGNYYDNMKDNVNGSNKGVTSAGKRSMFAFNGLLSDYAGNWNFLTMSRDMGQDEHFTVYQYDEPFTIDEITAFFSNYTNNNTAIDVAPPDAIRIDISTDNYVLPNRDLYNYVIREGTVENVDSSEPTKITVISTGQANDVKKGQYLVIGDEKRKITGNFSGNDPGGGREFKIESKFNQTPVAGASYTIEQHIKTINGTYSDITGQNVTAVVLPVDTNAVSETGSVSKNAGLNEISGNQSFMYLLVGDETDITKAHKVLKYDYSRRLLIVDGKVELKAGVKYSIESVGNNDNRARTKVQTNTGNTLSTIHVQNIHDDGGNRYAGYYLTIAFGEKTETRRIVSSAKGASSHTGLTVDSPFTFEEVPVGSGNQIEAIISVEDPNKEMKFPANGITLHAISVDWNTTQGIYDGNYLNLRNSSGDAYERREIIHYDKTGKRGTVYTLPFTTYPDVDTEGFIDSNGYGGQKIYQNEALLREDTYKALRDGTAGLEWTTIYEKGFNKEENLWGTDTPDWGALREKIPAHGSNFPVRHVITNSDIKNYIQANYSGQTFEDILKPTTLVKITYIRGDQFTTDDNARRTMDPTKQVGLGEVYINALEAGDTPDPEDPEVPEDTFEPIFDASSNDQLKGMKIISADGTHENSSVVVALYNNQGDLTGVTHKQHNVTASTDSPITFDTPIDLSTAGSYKIFLWENLNSIKPIFIYTPPVED